jgi:DNA-binding transcriptional MerR regulator
MSAALVTIEEAAEMVGVSVRRARYWVQLGLLKPVSKRGRAHLFLDRHVFEAELAHTSAKNVRDRDVPTL